MSKEVFPLQEIENIKLASRIDIKLTHAYKAIDKIISSAMGPEWWEEGALPFSIPLMIEPKDAGTLQSARVSAHFPSDNGLSPDSLEPPAAGGAEVIAYFSQPTDAGLYGMRFFKGEAAVEGGTRENYIQPVLSANDLSSRPALGEAVTALKSFYKHLDVTSCPVLGEAVTPSELKTVYPQHVNDIFRLTGAISNSIYATHTQVSKLDSQLDTIKAFIDASNENNLSVPASHAANIDGIYIRRVGGEKGLFVKFRDDPNLFSINFAKYGTASINNEYIPQHAVLHDGVLDKFEQAFDATIRQPMIRSLKPGK
jgi:hypothetical protein